MDNRSQFFDYTSPSPQNYPLRILPLELSAVFSEYSEIFFQNSELIGCDIIFLPMSHHQVPLNNFSQITSIDSAVREIQREINPDEAFWIADMNRPRESLSMWKGQLHGIKLFYAMKCCDEPNLLYLVADHGCGFDCASKDEISRILALGVTPDRIVFSHPIKSRESLRFAKENRVNRLVYDTIDELNKIMRYFPEAEVFLRVKPKFSNAVIQLSKKFGADMSEVSDILKHTKDVSANFIGFSFHVGSLCDDITTFRTALQYVADLKREAKDIGLTTSFIDIGGGFLPPNAPANHLFASVADAIKSAIDELFGSEQIEFIAEPGRFVASEYMDLCLPVICAKKQKDEKDGVCQSIYIPDGMYGSFNAICYDHAAPHFEMYAPDANFSKTVPTALWGQTCDSADCIYEEMEWPVLKVGDLLMVRKFGAYT
jgi:ornithine decarboxylase